MRTAIIVVMAASTAWLYGQRLSSAPPDLEIDEVLIGLDAHAIATTGRDLRGERLPLYSQTAEHSWYQPLVIYVTALALQLMPLSERAVRLPTVGIGVLNVVLMFFAARRLFASDALGALAAVMLALTPAHFLHSRYAMDYMYPVTFVLAWCLCLAAYVERPRPWLVVAAAAVLGVGFYSYISSVVMMPLYLVLTALFFAQYDVPRRTWIAAAAVFLVLLVPFLSWLVTHPAAFGATVEKYGVYDARHLSAAQGLRGLVSLQSVNDRLSMYWTTIGPSVLFLTGGSRVMFSTGRAGVFLLPLACLLPVGLYQAATHRRTPLHLLLVAGFLTAPLPALMVTDESAPVFRALALVPFGVLLATLGLRAMWASPLARTVTRIAAVGLLLLLPLQFRMYSSDYFNAYRVRASPWLGGNIRGALEALIDASARADAPALYFSTLQATSGLADGRNEYMNAYWRFYTTKHPCAGPGGHRTRLRSGGNPTTASAQGGRSHRRERAPCAGQSALRLSLAASLAAADRT